MIRRAFLLFLLASPIACGFQKSREEAEKTIARHFDAIAAHAYGRALEDYDDEFFAKTPRDGWGSTLAKVEAKLGPYQSYKVIGWNVNSRFGSGTYVGISLAVSYGKYPAEEQMVLFRKGDKDGFKITKHGISSEGLLKE